jgi:hypothetical protein
MKQLLLAIAVLLTVSSFAQDSTFVEYGIKSKMFRLIETEGNDIDTSYVQYSFENFKRSKTTLYIGLRKLKYNSDTVLISTKKSYNLKVDRNDSINNKPIWQIEKEIFNKLDTGRIIRIMRHTIRNNR